MKDMEVNAQPYINLNYFNQKLGVRIRNIVVGQTRSEFCSEAQAQSI